MEYIGKTSADEQTSPVNEHLLSRLSLPQLHPRLPCSYWTLKIIAFLSRVAISMRFLFVRQAFCLRLPSDSASRPTPMEKAGCF
jgi:hypothetical protein